MFLKQYESSSAEEQSTEVYFEESAWSIPVLAGIIDANVGLFDRMFAGLLVLLNFFMQGAFSWVLLTDAFIGEAGVRVPGLGSGISFLF